jgi:hypothetical protein
LVARVNWWQFFFLHSRRPAWSRGKFKRFDFVHDAGKGAFVLTWPDGTTQRFRDRPTRYLVVESDTDTGELRPAVKFGLPVYLYNCREDKEL